MDQNTNGESKDYRGPRFDNLEHDLQGTTTDPLRPSWRGWVLCFVSCAALGVIVPLSDNLIRSTSLSLNLLPSTSVFLILALVVLFNLVLARFRHSLSLRKQDLALIFCTTMVVNAIPSMGWMDYFAASQMGPQYYARPENNWSNLVHPYLTPGLSPQDPVDPTSPAPRPVEWFFSGLPGHQSIPWSLLIGPYLRWCAAMFLLMGLFFSTGSLIYRQWSRNERLAFPLAQVPETMLQGVAADSHRVPFLSNRMAWWGILLAFALHGWNGLGDLIGPNWPTLNLKITHLHTYLTEPPWVHLNPINVNIYPAVIGICYLISLEVSFSLWFFFLILRLAMLVAVVHYGLGYNGWDFHATEGPRSLFIGQGTGACLALVLAGFYMARKPLGESLKQALGLSPTDSLRDLSPRFLWGLATVCLFGSAAWLVWAGVSWYWALLVVVILLISATGVARLVAESGIFLIQMQSSSSELLCSMVSPAALGPKNYVMLSQWGRVFAFDWYRTLPFINMFTALHLGSVTGLRQRHLFWGLTAALLLVMGTGFFAFNYTAYRSPGGARQLGWEFDGYPRSEVQKWASNVQQMQAYEARKDEAAKTGQKLSPSEIPAAARVDKYYLSWIAVGAVVLIIFTLLRTRLFWWPHPIGYVMWMAERPLRQMWFSCLLGWLVKWALLKYGGHRHYMAWRTFFIGLIVGEAFATVFWLVLKACLGLTGGYSLEIN